MMHVRPSGPGERRASLRTGVVEKDSRPDS